MLGVHAPDQLVRAESRLDPWLPREALRLEKVIDEVLVLAGPLALGGLPVERSDESGEALLRERGRGQALAERGGEVGEADGSSSLGVGVLRPDRAGETDAGPAAREHDHSPPQDSHCQVRALTGPYGMRCITFTCRGIQSIEDVSPP